MAKPGRKRQEAAEMWAKYYPRPLANLIAIVTQPFDDDDNTLSDATVRACKAARIELRELFPRDQTRPPGGHIEAPLLAIGHRLLDALQADEAASVSAHRVELAIGQLGDVALVRDKVDAKDLVVPEAAKRLDGDVPFAMWR